MTPADLTARLHASTGAVSRWVNSHRIPSIESCYAIADALDLLPSDVMRAAGHPVDTVPGPSELETRLLGAWRKLAPDKQEDVMAFVEFLRDRERREG